MTKIHQIEPLNIENRTLTLIVDGQTHTIDLTKHSKKLASATPEQLKTFVIAPSGYGIHWPQLNEDLAIDPLIGIQQELPYGNVAEETPSYKT